MHADEVDVDDGLVRRLIAEQFPEHVDLPLRRARSTGTDNAIYRLGPDLGLRLPRIDWAVQQIGKEHEWLPRLARHLPAAVPEPVAVGEPSAGYPYPWLVYRWLDGHDALAGPVGDWCRLAEHVAGFVLALQRVDPAGAPPTGGRGGPLSPRDEATRRAIARLDGLIDTRRALSIWAEALSAEPWTRPAAWGTRRPPPRQRPHPRRPTGRRHRLERRRHRRPRMRGDAGLGHASRRPSPLPRRSRHG